MERKTNPIKRGGNGMITHEEAREKTLYLHGKYDEAYKTLNDYISQQEKLQAEHEALKKDVARFMYLLSKENTTNKESFEVVTLGEKLSKVGKEE